jgi:outer membrane protein assembly factor BamE (lipoprotein component of BamABCDE complex)
MKKVLITVIALALAGCGASSGTKISDQQLAQLEVGKTTRAGALVILGKPNSETAISTGQRVMVWAYSEIKTRPETFIPFAGAFVGGADGKSGSVVLTFDKSGVLERTGATNTNTSANLSPGQ